MDIQKFEYIYNEYATTNPPRSVSTAYTLENFSDDSVSLTYFTYYNGDENEKKFKITNPEYKEISDIFQNDNIVEEIEKQCAAGLNVANPNLMMVGGNVSRGITVIKASGEELKTVNIPDNANRLLKYLSDLVKENITPAATEDNWYCSGCGAANTGGNFCSNCGNKRIN